MSPQLHTQQGTTPPEIVAQTEKFNVEQTKIENATKVAKSPAKDDKGGMGGPPLQLATPIE